MNLNFLKQTQQVKLESMQPCYLLVALLLHFFDERVQASSFGRSEAEEAAAVAGLLRAVQGCSQANACCCGGFTDTSLVSALERARLM